jgi:NAD+ kinase
MKLAINGRITETTDDQFLERFFSGLRKKHILFKVQENYALQLNQRASFNANPITLSETYRETAEVSSFDFVYSIGGDGTLLETVRRFRRTSIPVLGVNTGRLGFLANTSLPDLEAATEDLLKGTYKLDQRTMMVLETRPQGSLFSEDNVALNDITIHKSNTNEMITVHTYINGDFLNSYWGDGVILSTPTGSTAYSLSCGGPVIMPGTPAFVITPIAPHALTVRPMVIPDHSVISLEIESRSGQALIALDSRTEVIRQKTELAVRKADFTTPLVRVQSSSYFSSLRNRLHWGLDNRN